MGMNTIAIMVATKARGVSIVAHGGVHNPEPPYDLKRDLGGKILSVMSRILSFFHFLWL
jgi:hypothetical protein